MRTAQLYIILGYELITTKHSNEWMHCAMCHIPTRCVQSVSLLRQEEAGVYRQRLCKQILLIYACQKRLVRTNMFLLKLGPLYAQHSESSMVAGGRVEVVVWAAVGVHEEVHQPCMPIVCPRIISGQDQA